MKLSVCIPTFNRATHLANCLNSIILCNSQVDFRFQVCISDNNSTDETQEVVCKAQSKIDIKYHRNTSNLGIPRNFLNVVSMADGEFVWLIGDDDLLVPHAIEELYKLIDEHRGVDFFYVNSFHLHTEFLGDFPSPFDTANLPSNMPPFSKWAVAGEMDFLDLINPKVSFDFLGGMFLSVFRRKNWEQNVSVLDRSAIMDTRLFSHFDNTFPHVKIFAKSFSKSKAYFNTKPLNVCLTGAREWSPMYPFIRSVRLIEALQEYRNNGLPYWRYLYCKNHALKHSVPDFIKILLTRDKSGYIYIRLSKLLLEYCWFPNFYLSFFYFLGRRLRKYCGRFIYPNS
jgi:glycosyltransferase involved in cell wall biosynthesis